MAKSYRVIVQTLDFDKVLSESVVLKETLSSPSNCIDFSMGLDKQIKLVQGVQDHVLDAKLQCVSQDFKECPECQIKLVKCGKQKSYYHDVFTDHRVTFQRMKCTQCGYELPCTVRSMFNSIQSGDLQRIQAELGAKHSFREAEDILDLFSGYSRGINNHDRVKKVSESIGQSLTKIMEDEKEAIKAQEATELVLNVDGGHIKTTEKGRSIEAMTSVVYKPEAILYNKKGTRKYLSSKNCAASVKNDNQEEIISNTIIAALKQGMTSKTHITALCDGAQNCWNVVDALKPLSSSVTCILDWFHISMKMENISLPRKLKEKFLRIKWHLWRGRADLASIRLEQLSELTKIEKHADRINKFKNYINNNINRIVDYRKRKRAGLVFTSNLAESTVESLINQRCKGKQHMRWSREGLNPILQIRAVLNSKGEWKNKWKTAVLNAV